MIPVPSGVRVWLATGATATTLANSTSKPSPMSFTMRPLRSVIFGCTNSVPAKGRARFCRRPWPRES